MTETKERVSAMEGWFTLDEESPKLIGTRCQACSAVYFPRETIACRNPSCSSRTFEEVELSSRGKIWSFTNNHYQPPAPYRSVEPFEPYTIAAVELDEEKMIVLGQVAADVAFDDLRVGLPMELTLGTLYEDDDKEYLVWKWRPSASAA
jgi:uncharacterized OB-fold protein|tara:strand:- start:85 stop:531 length:447 start_codon:yes stop_codon:yes gene_type:complete